MIMEETVSSRGVREGTGEHEHSCIPTPLPLLICTKRFCFFLLAQFANAMLVLEQLPRSNKQCPKCNEMEAVFFQSQQRTSETGMVCLPPSAPLHLTTSLLLALACLPMYTNESSPCRNFSTSVAAVAKYSTKV